MNFNHILKNVGRRSDQNCLMRFSESTCSGVSKNSNLVKVRELLGQLVPQHDVYTKCASRSTFGFVDVVLRWLILWVT
jgi:hypothetical protein